MGVRQYKVGETLFIKPGTTDSTYRDYFSGVVTKVDQGASMPYEVDFGNGNIYWVHKNDVGSISDVFSVGDTILIKPNPRKQEYRRFSRGHVVEVDSNDARQPIRVDFDGCHRWWVFADDILGKETVSVPVSEASLEFKVGDTVIVDRQEAQRHDQSIARYFSGKVVKIDLTRPDCYQCECEEYAAHDTLWVNPRYLKKNTSEFYIGMKVKTNNNSQLSSSRRDKICTVTSVDARPGEERPIHVRIDDNGNHEWLYRHTFTLEKESAQPTYSVGDTVVIDRHRGASDGMSFRTYRSGRVIAVLSNGNCSCEFYNGEIYEVEPIYILRKEDTYKIDLPVFIKPEKHNAYDFTEGVIIEYDANDQDAPIFVRGSNGHEMWVGKNDFTLQTPESISAPDDTTTPGSFEVGDIIDTTSNGECVIIKVDLGDSDLPYCVLVRATLSFTWIRPSEIKGKIKHVDRSEYTPVGNDVVRLKAFNEHVFRVVSVGLDRCYCRSVDNPNKGYTFFYGLLEKALNVPEFFTVEQCDKVPTSSASTEGFSISINAKRRFSLWD